MKIRRYTVDICDDCYDMRGDECHTPGCAFFLKSVAEVAKLLDATLIRPKVGKAYLDLNRIAPVIYDDEGGAKPNGK